MLVAYLKSPKLNIMNTIKYTVIIPHYRSLDLLIRCVESIPYRSDIQVIIIDDNSGIDKQLFYDQSSLARNNIELIFLSVGGSAGRARNAGLEKACGKWLLFADADDYFMSDSFSLCDKYYDSEYDIIYFGVDSKAITNSDHNQSYKKTYNELVQQCDNVTTDLINKLRFTHDVPWGKMIRRSLVTDNSIKFGETRYCNDTLFSTYAAVYASSVFADKSLFYCVTSDPNSLSSRRSVDANFIRYEVILQKNMILRDAGYSSYQYLIIYSLYPCIKNLQPRNIIRSFSLAKKYGARILRDLFIIIRKRLLNV